MEGDCARRVVVGKVIVSVIEAPTGDGRRGPGPYII